MASGLANARPPGSAKFANAPPSGLTNAPQWPWGEGGAGRRWNWLMHNWTTLTTTDQSFPYQKAIKAYAYVITRRQHLINNFNLFSDFIFSDNGCKKSGHKIVWTVCGKHSGSISNRLLVIMISFDSYFKFHRQKPLINKNYFLNELGSSLLPWKTWARTQCESASEQCDWKIRMKLN